MRTRGRPVLGIALVMSVVLASLVLGARLPSGEAVHRLPPGFALNYEGAPPASFVELVARSGGDEPDAGAQAPAFPVSRGAPHPAAQTCDGSPIRTPRCEGPDGGNESSPYVAMPAGSAGVRYERYPLGLSGQHFRTPTPVLSVLVADQNGPGVQVRVCQNSRTGNCNPAEDADRIQVHFCSTGDPVELTGYGFKRGYFIVQIDVLSPDCPTRGSTGTITVTW